MNIWAVLISVVLAISAGVYFYEDTTKQKDRVEESMYLNTMLESINVGNDTRKTEDTVANGANTGLFADTLMDYVTNNDIILDDTLSGAGSFFTHRKLKGVKVYVTADQVGTYDDVAMKLLVDGSERKALEGKSDTEAKNFENKIANIYKSRYAHMTPNPIITDGSATALGAPNSNATATALNSDMIILIGGIR